MKMPFSLRWPTSRSMVFAESGIIADITENMDYMRLNSAGEEG